MQTTLEIPPQLFERLQKLAIPLVDTLVTVIERLADHYEATASIPVKEMSSTPSNGVRKFDPIKPPNLLHTQVAGTFGDVPFRKWSELVHIAHIEAFKQAGSFEALRTATSSQIRKGEHDDSGFRYIPDIGISVQGVDAPHAWNYSLRLAQYTKKPIKASVTWRNKEKAAFPGESAVIEWQP